MLSIVSNTVFVSLFAYLKKLCNPLLHSVDRFDRKTLASSSVLLIKCSTILFDFEHYEENDESRY